MPNQLIPAKIEIYNVIDISSSNPFATVCRVQERNQDFAKGGAWKVEKKFDILMTYIR